MRWCTKNDKYEVCTISYVKSPFCDKLFLCNSLVLYFLFFYHVLRPVYKGSICILFPFSKPQMKSFSTFCPSLKGNRGVVCTVTLSTDPHTGLGKEYLNVFCILNKRQILQSCGTCWRKMHSHKKTCTNSFS